MACTRDINSPANYCLEQKAIKNQKEHHLFINGPNGHAYNPAFPELYNNGRVPSNVLSCNGVDIESKLFGIDSNNLVNPRESTVAQLKTLPNTSFFDRPEFSNSKKVNQDISQRPFIVR